MHNVYELLIFTTLYLENIFNRIFFDHPGAVSFLLILLGYRTYIFDHTTYESVDISLCRRTYAVRKSEINIY